MLILLLICLASSSTTSDNYGYKVPEPFIKDNIRFTAPVIQSMQYAHVSQEDVEKLIKSNPEKTLISEGGLHLTLKKDPHETFYNLINLWRE